MQICGGDRSVERVEIKSTGAQHLTCCIMQGCVEGTCTHRTGKDGPFVGNGSTIAERAVQMQSRLKGMSGLTAAKHGQVLGDILAELTKRGVAGPRKVFSNAKLLHAST